ncbi:MAG: Lrp/AsnC family transcriptional regulator, leucine-responsive regulatory protein [Chloroflexota bacterium]|nr:Lrp/AsnC family transcriptional regulator, leucine-responsive regulatory protein [Chloroflexota bacterium]
MDPIDRQILEILQANSRASASEISKAVQLSLPAVSERMRKLEDSGVIAAYSIRVDRAAAGYHLLAMLFVSLERTDQIEHFRRTVTALPQVLECHHIAGEYDYLLKLLLRDTAELEDFLSRQLKAIPGVARTNTQIILSSLKEEINRPLED